MAFSLLTAWNSLDVARFKAEFYRMWHAGYRAGLDHSTALGGMDDFKRSPAVERIRGHLLAGAKRRQSLATLIRTRPELFGPFEAALLVLGEESGALETCMRLLADYFTAEHRMIMWLKKKLSYPMFQALAATFIAPFPLLFFGHTAQYVLAVAGGLALLFTAGGSALLAAARWFGNRPKFVRARLARALTIAIEAGLPLGRAVELAVDAAASPEIAAHVGRMTREAVSRQPLAATFRTCPMIPREMLAAMEVADVTGDYGGTLKKLAELYDGGFGG